MTKNVLVIEDFCEAALVRRMFSDDGWEHVSEIDDVDLLVFVGGPDVDPAMYGQNMHPTTHINKERDVYEQMMFYKALERGIPMAGICRGGQFLNVMNGGEMYQDVDNHNCGYHDAFIVDAVLPVRVNSVHHQMMIPNYKEDPLCLMKAKMSTVKYQMNRSDATSKIAYATRPVMTGQPTDCEAVYYPNSRCLCYQPHPEYRGENDKETKEIFNLFLSKYILADEEAVAA